jgi:hypothetical protein
MDFDGRLLDVQKFRDLPICETVPQELEDFAFSRGKQKPTVVIRREREAGGSR